MRMKVGSLEPGFTVFCLNDGEPFDFTDCTVVFEATQAVGELFSDDDPDVDLDAGSVTHVWTEGETDVRGRAYGLVSVYRLDGRRIVFPPFGPQPIDFD